MSRDPGGYLEVKRGSGWEPVLRLYGFLRAVPHELVDCLFERSSTLQFDPIAAGRGVPGNASEDVWLDWEHLERPSASWVDWTEIIGVDHADLSPGLDEGPTRYRRVMDEHGRTVEWALADDPRLHGASGKPRDTPVLEEEKGEFLYRWERRSRREALWTQHDRRARALMEIFRVLAEEYGAANVRLIYWTW